MINQLTKFFLHKDILHSYNVLRNFDADTKSILDTFSTTAYFTVGTIFCISAISFSIKTAILFFIIHGIFISSYVFWEYIRDWILSIKHGHVKKQFEKIFIHDPKMTKALMDFIDFPNLKTSDQNKLVYDISKESFSFESIHIIYTNFYKVKEGILKQQFMEPDKNNSPQQQQVSSKLKFFNQNN